MAPRYVKCNIASTPTRGGSHMSLSLVHGDEQEPLIEDTIGAALEARAKETPDGVALIVPYQGVRWTWSELNARTDELATGLIARGLKPGERIGIWSPNRVEWVLTQFATAKAGLILVNINPAYRLPEVEYALNKVACRALITSPAFKSSDYVGMLRELGPKRLPELEMVVTLGNEAHDGFIPIGELMGPADPQVCARSRRRLIVTMPSIFNSPVAPPDSPRGRHLPIAIFSTMVTSSPSAWGCEAMTGCAFRSPFIIASEW